jgi:hypothetical protein
MVAARGRRGVVINAAIAQPTQESTLPGVGVAAVAAGPPPVPNVIAVQPPGLPPLTPLEQAFTEIGFSVDAARMLTSPNN